MSFILGGLGRDSGYLGDTWMRAMEYALQVAPLPISTVPLGCACVMLALGEVVISRSADTDFFRHIEFYRVQSVRFYRTVIGMSLQYPSRINPG